MFKNDESHFSFIRFVPGVGRHHGDKEHTLPKTARHRYTRDSILGSGGDLRRGESEEIEQKVGVQLDSWLLTLQGRCSVSSLVAKQR